MTDVLVNYLNSLLSNAKVDGITGLGTVTIGTDTLHLIIEMVRPTAGQQSAGTTRSDAPVAITRARHLPDCPALYKGIPSNCTCPQTRGQKWGVDISGGRASWMEP